MSRIITKQSRNKLNVIERKSLELVKAAETPASQETDFEKSKTKSLRKSVKAEKKSVKVEKKSS